MTNNHIIKSYYYNIIKSKNLKSYFIIKKKFLIVLQVIKYIRKKYLYLIY